MLHIITVSQRKSLSAVPLKTTPSSTATSAHSYKNKTYSYWTRTLFENLGLSLLKQGHGADLWKGLCSIFILFTANTLEQMSHFVKFNCGFCPLDVALVSVM